MKTVAYYRTLPESWPPGTYEKDERFYWDLVTAHHIRELEKRGFLVREKELKPVNYGALALFVCGAGLVKLRERRKNVAT